LKKNGKKKRNGGKKRKNGKKRNGRASTIHFVYFKLYELKYLFASGFKSVIDLIKAFLR
jgi:hypothetical protein